jgi:hypothetical protein
MAGHIPRKATRGCCIGRRSEESIPKGKQKDKKLLNPY